MDVKPRFTASVFIFTSMNSEEGTKSHRQVYCARLGNIDLFDFVPRTAAANLFGS